MSASERFSGLNPLARSVNGFEMSDVQVSALYVGLQRSIGSILGGDS